MTFVARSCAVPALTWVMCLACTTSLQPTTPRVQRGSTKIAGSLDFGAEERHCRRALQERQELHDGWKPSKRYIIKVSVVKQCKTS